MDLSDPDTRSIGKEPKHAITVILHLSVYHVLSISTVYKMTWHHVRNVSKSIWWKWHDFFL